MENDVIVLNNIIEIPNETQEEKPKQKDDIQVLDLSNIVTIPSDTEVPVSDKTYWNTQRPLCTEFPRNKEIIRQLEAVLKPAENLECASDLFGDTYDTIVNIDELKKTLSELLIRFDTNPKNYTKEDYQYLMGILYKTLLYIYRSNTESVVINEWNENPREDRVPSEKLISEKIGEEVEKVSGDIFATNTRLDAEINNRIAGDRKVINDLLPLIYAGL